MGDYRLSGLHLHNARGEAVNIQNPKDQQQAAKDHGQGKDRKPQRHIAHRSPRPAPTVVAAGKQKRNQIKRLAPSQQQLLFVKLLFVPQPPLEKLRIVLQKILERKGVENKKDSEKNPSLPIIQRPCGNKQGSESQNQSHGEAKSKPEPKAHLCLWRLGGSFLLFVLALRRVLRHGCFFSYFIFFYVPCQI